MPYIKDNDLEFLQHCNNQELEELFNLLTYDPKNGSKRLTSSLLNSEEYKLHKDDYQKYWQTIAGELQLYGGNTLVNLFRKGKGVKYRELLFDVAKRLKIPTFTFISTPEIENAICERLLLDLFSKMKDKDIEKFLSELELHNDEVRKMININEDIPWRKISTLLVREIFKIGGMVTYRATATLATVIWKELFGKSISVTANYALTKVVAGLLSGPVAIALNAWIIADITGPAMRITIPAVVLISTLRQKHCIEDEE